MFVRRERKEFKSGTRTYLSVAHSVREKAEDGKSRTRPIVLMNLGREDEVDPAMVQGVVGALQRYLAKRRTELTGTSTEAALAQAVADEVAPQAAGIKKLLSKSLGISTLLEGAWKSLGLGRVFRSLERDHKVEFPFERIVFGLVWNRIVDPKSKLAANDWLQGTAYFPEAENLKVQHFYRALDLLEDHNEEAQVRLLGGLEAELPEEDWKTTGTDTTSTYYESSVNDEDRAEIQALWDAHDKAPQKVPEPHWPRPQVVNDPPLRMQGFSKDSRPRSPQVKIGVLTNPSGFVMYHQVAPGNETDGEIALDLLEAYENATSRTVPVWIGDAGMGTTTVLDELDNRDDLERVSAKSLRGKFVRERVLGIPGRYRKHPTREGWSYRVVSVSKEESPHGRAELWIVTRNDKDRARRIELIDRHVARVKTALERDDRIDGRSDGVLTIVKNDGLKKYVKKVKPRDPKAPTEEERGRYVLNSQRIVEEKRAGGLRAICATGPDRDPLQVIEQYRSLWRTELAFKTFKGPLKLRPMYHRADRRIRAHVLLCAISLNVVRYLETKTGCSLKEIKDVWANHTASLMQQGEKTWWLREAYTDVQSDMLEKVNAKPRPEVWLT